MCGFVGFTGKIDKSQTVLDAMMHRILHRGPDMGSSYIGDGVALGFRRLSILDLTEAGNQPMMNEDKSVVVVFNGEIYNFMELRADLEAKGHTFHCGADTEVLIHGYEEYGTDFINKLRGMYAFVIWDAKNKRMFGARDIFGIKPFYYYVIPNNEGMIFGSEIKSFLEHPKFKKEVNEKALRPYLTLQYSSMPETFFKGVFKLPAAHYFVFENGKMTVTRYWDCEFDPKPQPYDECVDKLDDVIHESVKSHQIADVKVGAFLSGGVDSSYITATQMPDNTFSVGFDYNKFNETNYASELSEKLGITNYRELLTADQCFDAFEDIQYHMDEPQSNPSSVPLYFLAKLAREHVTVVLSGEGADEIFAGYEWYADTPAMEKFKKLPLGLRRAMGAAANAMPYFKGKNFLLKCAEKPEKSFLGQALVFREEEAEEILQPLCKNGEKPYDIAAPIYARVKDADEVTKKQYLDMNMWLPGDILLKADKMTMAHSLELRVPFLDKKVMEFAETIPTDYRINGTDTKIVLRAAANKALPDEWANRPKKGFPVPIKFWLREEKYYNIVKEYFESDYAATYFKPDAIMALLNDHYTEKANNQRKIWTIFTFLVWYKRFFLLEK
ncbi:MAG: asparagine synthase (glutamine-hydrolyzing) [Clostridia bacterium]|jgi:asparagine synthase (glutamine-hydrolysing)|nr:asparagine synthase (glutamine-hydrolyzing) [Clostridia bacterium]NLS85315.1 asparagine synthase (glutamine-hydrolyzing) [Oscillospiraceae bacterium]